MTSLRNFPLENELINLTVLFENTLDYVFSKFQVCQLLIEHVKHRHPRTYYCFGKTPLQMAYENGHSKVVEILQSDQYGADCNIL